jgi:5-methylcytosine-specific restriction endonuclease McrA
MDTLACSICGRIAPDASCMERHHLVPQGRAGKDTIPVCVDCGNQIHMLFSNNDLRYKYNTLEALLSDERVQKWVRWIRKRPYFGVCAKEKKRR